MTLTLNQQDMRHAIQEYISNHAGHDVPFSAITIKDVNNAVVELPSAFEPGQNTIDGLMIRRIPKESLPHQS